MTRLHLSPEQWDAINDGAYVVMDGQDTATHSLVGIARDANEAVSLLLDRRAGFYVPRSRFELIRVEEGSPVEVAARDGSPGCALVRALYPIDRSLDDEDPA